MVVAGVVLGVAAPSWACDVVGKVVCATDQSKGVSGVEVQLFSAPDPATFWVGETVKVVSGPLGEIDATVNGWNQWYDVSYSSLDYRCGVDTPNPGMIELAPLLVDDPVQCPTTPACTAKIPAGVQFPYCPARPLGNPRNECAFFGLEVLDKDEGVVSFASTSAVLAIIKAAGCYGIIENVTEGDPIRPPGTQAVSHVTYCTCPKK